MLLTKEVFDVLKMRKIRRKSLNKFQQRKELKEKPLEVFDHSEIVKLILATRWLPNAIREFDLLCRRIHFR